MTSAPCVLLASILAISLQAQQQPPQKSTPRRTVTPKPSAAPAAVPAKSQSPTQSATLAPAPMAPLVNYGNAFFAGPDKTLHLLFKGSLYRLLAETGDSWGRIAEGVRFATVDPRNAQIIYSVNSNGVVMKTLDRGGRWLNINNGLPGTTGRWLTVNPVKADEVFVGTDNGLYRTLDAGFTWQPTTLLGPVRQYVISSKLNSTSYALTAAGLFASSDNAQNWRRIDTALPKITVRQSSRTASAVAPTIDHILLSKTDSLLAFTAEKGVFRSADGGVTWVEANQGLPAGSRFFSAYDGPSSVLIASSGALYRSADGLSWQQVPINLPSGIQVGPLLGIFQSPSQPGIYLADSSPTDPDGRLLAYVEPSGQLLGLNYGVLSHSEIVAIQPTRSGNRAAILVMAANNGYVDAHVQHPTGILKNHPHGPRMGLGPGMFAISFDEGHAWQPLQISSDSYDGHRYAGYRSPRFASPPNHPSDLYLNGVGPDLPLRRSQDGGLTWSVVDPDTGNGWNRSARWKIDSFSFVPNDPTLAFYTTSLTAANYTVCRYKSGSGSQAQTTDLKLPGASTAGRPPDVAVLDSEGKVLYTSSGSLSTDGGWTWADKSGAIGKAKLTYFELLSASANEILGYSKDTSAFSTSFALARSRDLGDSWEVIYQAAKGEEVLWIKSSDNLPGHLFLSKSARAAAAKDSGGTLLIVLSESIDGGRSWRDLYSVPYSRNAYTKVGDVLRDAAIVRTGNGSVVYVGGQVGLLRSKDEGKTWQQIGGIR